MRKDRYCFTSCHRSQRVRGHAIVSTELKVNIIIIIFIFHPKKLPGVSEVTTTGNYHCTALRKHCFFYIFSETVFREYLRKMNKDEKYRGTFLLSSASW